jgi:Na+/proline symporter
MSYTFLTTAFFIIWSLFGLCVLFSLDDDAKKPSLRLAIVVGPIIMIFGLVIAGFLLLIEKAADWVK